MCATRGTDPRYLGPVVSPSYSTRASARRVPGLDWLLLALVMLVSVWGCLSVISATQPATDSVAAAREAYAPTSPVPDVAPPSAANGASSNRSHRGHSQFSDASKQIAFVTVGLLAMLAVALMNYQWLMHMQGTVYFATIAGLVLVMILPHSLAPSINGARCWIVLGPLSLQMGEFAKLGLLVSLSAFVTRRQERIGNWKTVALSLLYVAPPLILILKEPDLGTCLAAFSIWVGVLFFGGARLWHLGLVFVLGLAIFAGAWKFHLLKPYQVARLTSFLDPNAKASAGGYQLHESLIAIGGGQVTGQGFEHGMQNRAHYVPENQTDFIFTVVAEEFGFAGAALLLACYLVILWRAAALATTTENYFGVLLCGGFTSLLAFHCVLNLGMTMRIMPISGIPLPFFSYGGSSFLTFSLCAGLLQSVALHRRNT